jgi:hypothetical protein
MGCTSSKGVGTSICGPETLRMLQNILGMMQARNACREVAMLELLLKLMNDPALKSFGGSPGHPEGAGADLTELHEKAGWFRVELEKMIKGFLRRLDIDPQTEIKALDEEGKEKVFKAFTMAGLKTIESCKRKMTDDYDGDHMRICDVVRCSIVVETEEQLAAVLKALLDGQMKGEGVKVTVARLKNRFAEPMFTGIMDCLLNVLVEVEGQGGHVCEIQVRPRRQPGRAPARPSANETSPAAGGVRGHARPRRQQGGRGETCDLVGSREGEGEHANSPAAGDLRPRRQQGGFGGSPPDNPRAK